MSFGLFLLNIDLINGFDSVATYKYLHILFHVAWMAGNRYFVYSQNRNLHVFLSIDGPCIVPGTSSRS